MPERLNTFGENCRSIYNLRPGIYRPTALFLAIFLSFNARHRFGRTGTISLIALMFLAAILSVPVLIVATLAKFVIALVRYALLQFALVLNSIDPRRCQRWGIPR